MRFHKYQALGNDYLLLEPGAVDVTARVVRAICDRHRGVGADGVLVEGRGTNGFSVRILNPDGGRARGPAAVRALARRGGAVPRAPDAAGDMTRPPVKLVFESALACSRAELWAAITDLRCLRREMMPYLRMTAPPGVRRLTDVRVTPGTPLFASTIL